jgi:hypothetical protein
MAKWYIHYESPITVLTRYSTQAVRFWRKWDNMTISYIVPEYLKSGIVEQRKAIRTK